MAEDKGSKGLTGVEAMEWSESESTMEANMLDISDTESENSETSDEETLSVKEVFQNFPSVTTLDLDDFPLTLTNLYAPVHLKELRTLSIRSPRKGREFAVDLDHIRQSGSLPPVTNLCICIDDIGAAGAVSNVVKLFEESITMLSICGSNDDGREFLRKIMVIGFHTIGLENLKHSNLDFLGMDCTRFVRMFLSIHRSLESIAIDCRGIAYFLTLSYVIDLIRIMAREDFDIKPMLEYEKVGPTPYDNIWSARIARFSCTFATVETETSPKRMLDTLELHFALQDEFAGPINENIRLIDLSQILHARMPTFRGLKSLGSLNGSALASEIDRDGRRVEGLH